MPNHLPLTGKTIILTGSSKTQVVVPFIERNGGNVYSLPLIEIQEKMSEQDADKLEHINDYDWLIFTSQNAVNSFVSKCARMQLTPAQIQCKIAVVGEKTANSLRQHGFTIHFMPSVYSADKFVQEFNAEGRKLFIRGSLAKPTITVGLGAEEWTVYETVPCKQHIATLITALQQEQDPIVVFASPSAVHVYAQEIVPHIAWEHVRFATIGHVTTNALSHYDVAPIVQPETYTMQAVIKQIILEVSTS